MAATKELKMGGSSYGEYVVIVANDWHAALVPMYVKLAQAKGEWKDCRTAALLHNMVFQGRFPVSLRTLRCPVSHQAGRGNQQKKDRNERTKGSHPGSSPIAVSSCLRKNIKSCLQFSSVP